MGLVYLVGGCGGIVDSQSGDAGPAGARTGAGGSASGGGSEPGGLTGTGGVTKPKPLCGNGRIDSGEECDQTLGGTTCSAATMGARPIGVLRCTSACKVDTSGCRSGGTGGMVGTGGVGHGGTAGTGGGVGGSAGVVVTPDACYSTPSILANDCTQKCGCGACPDIYATCRKDGGCAWILSCAQSQGCASVAQCYQTPCKYIIDTAGGLMSGGAFHADPTLACLAKSGCGVACQ